MDGRHGMTAVPSPSGSNLSTFFRWCLGGMPGLASVSGSASARDADAGARALEELKKVEAECGHLSAEQLDILARSHFLGGDRGGLDEEEEAEVFSTPPLTQQGQSQAAEREDDITMCSVPFTQTPPSSPSPASSSSSDSWELRQRKPRKPRICMRKVRRGAMLRTPTPTPPSEPEPSPRPSPELDPLVRIVLMIPTAPLGTTGAEDILELARSRGIF